MESWVVGLVSVLIGLAAGWWVGTRSGNGAMRVLRETVAAAESRLATVEADRAAMASKLQETELQAARLDERSARVDALTEESAIKERALQSLQSELAGTKAQLARLETAIAERDRAIAEQRGLLETAESRLADTFKALSGETLAVSVEELRKSARELLETMKDKADGDLGHRQQAIDELLRPVRERLQALDEQNQAMELRRQGAYQELLEQVRALGDQQVGLTRETTRLVRALQDPGSAGQWGEMVLERVVEMAGLEEHVSFDKQETVRAGDLNQRPDLTVRLPGGRTIVVDSKAPMRSYLEALETDDEGNRADLLLAHSKRLLEHAKELKRKDYTKAVEGTPDFVVLFVPSEAAFRAALEHRPGLMEEALACNVLLASPLSLLGLLRLASHSWRQERLAESARQIVQDAKTLYERLGVVADHYNRLGGYLGRATEAYNDLGRSMESRLLPAARRLQGAGVHSRREVALEEPISTAPIPIRTSGLPVLERGAEEELRATSSGDPRSVATDCL